MSIDLKKIKSFHEKMENNKWYDLESLKKKSNPLSEIKEAKKFFQEYFALDKKDMEQVISYKGHVHYFPWNIEIITSSDGSKRGKHKKTEKDYNYKLGLPLTAETFPEYREEIEDLEKGVEEKKENSGKCSKNSPCQACKNELKQKLSECKDWEVKRKEYIKSWFPFHDEEGNKVKYSETGGYNLEVCSKCKKSWEKSNSHGDINPVNHDCKNDNIEREREREREREQIRKYFIKHDIKSITLQDNNLIITYNNQQEKETKEIKDFETQQIKSFAEKLGKKELTLSDLEQSSNQTNSPKSNKGLYIGLAIGGGLLVVGLVVWLLMKNKKEKEIE